MAHSTSDTPSLPLSRTVGCICGLAGFAIAIFAGLGADNPTDVILSRALVGLAVCAAIGGVIGAAASNVINESVARHVRTPATEPAPNAGAAGP